MRNFVKNIGVTAWWGINKAYGVGTITYKGEASDSCYSQGKNLTIGTIWAAVAAAIKGAELSDDTNGIYLVLSSR